MKVKLYITIGLLTTSALGCQNFNMNDDLSVEDQIAVQGMEQAYKLAIRYNDSLNWCVESNPYCTEALVSYYDNEYHKQDNLFEKSHNSYSHQNGMDDHWHGNERKEKQCKKGIN